VRHRAVASQGGRSSPEKYFAFSDEIRPLALKIVIKKELLKIKS